MQVVYRDGADGTQHVHFVGADLIGVEGNRRLHGDQRKDLQQVVLDHIAQCPGMIVIPAPVFHSHLLGHRDLHVVDIAPVPDRLEQGIGEAECQDVLHGFLAQVMVDAIDL